MITETLTRRQALGWVLVLWAAIYLPALGSLEIKGEEGRRILPAVTMLETGNWVVPSIGGVDYLSKPPLINWLIAAAFRLDPAHSEWAARMPTALCALGLGLAAVGALSSWLTPGGALVAALFTLTNIGLMEKGRLAEIEGLYVALTGVALLTWLGAWRAGASPWRTWTVPWVFLGLGLLAKGPLHAVFFYVTVVAILSSHGRLRELWNGPHLVGLGLMLGIFALWAIPYLHQTSLTRVGEVWRAQFEGRMEVNEGFHLDGWLRNIPRGLVNYVPWVVLVPLLWRPGMGESWPAPDRAILRGGRTALAGCFLAVSLAPGGMPRYTLPLLTLASVLLALVFTREWHAGRLPPWLPKVWARTVLLALAVTLGGALAALLVARDWAWALAVGGGLAAGLAINRRRLGGASPGGQTLAQLYPAPILAIASAVVMASITWEYAVAAVPRMRQAEDVRPLAALLNRATASSPEPICALSPGFLPFLFYLRQAPRYVQSVDDLPEGARFLLLREKETRAAAATLAGRGRASQVLLRLADTNRGNWTLLAVDPPANRGL